MKAKAKKVIARLRPNRIQVGIDEAGRGPLAGPVAVGICAVSGKIPEDFSRRTFDSKQISPKEREFWYIKMEEARSAGTLRFHVAMRSAWHIDRKGIVHAIQDAMKECIEMLSVEEQATIFLDGGLKLDSRFKKQQTIIKGDSKIALIGLASIAAKVTRDRHMEKLASKFPQYDFAEHKGYGTRKHRAAIRKHGASKAHRVSFLRNISKI